MAKIKILTFYKFVSLNKILSLKNGLLQTCLCENVTGSIILASEGINGTIAGSEKEVDVVLKYIRGISQFSDIESKESFTLKIPFNRIKIKIKKEIVSLRQPEASPNLQVGTYVSPENWNAIVEDDDVVLIDTRNDYEVKLGSFQGAVNPVTSNFTEFPKWWSENANQFKNKKIAMFCTGGIRCEKATSYLLSQGVKDVFHLRGGILKYLERIEETESLWKGDCFVFDQRVSVKQGLNTGKLRLCFACRRPISDLERKHKHYEEGVSCSTCINEHSEKRKIGFRERQKQLKLFKKKLEINGIKN